MSNFSEQKASVQQKLEWCRSAIEHVYNNCDENSELFEAACDAWFIIAEFKTELEGLLRSIEESQAAPDTPTQRTE